MERRRRLTGWLPVLHTLPVYLCSGPLVTRMSEVSLSGSLMPVLLQPRLIGWNTSGDVCTRWVGVSLCVLLVVCFSMLQSWRHFNEPEPAVTPPEHHPPHLTYVDELMHQRIKVIKDLPCDVYLKKITPGSPRCINSLKRSEIASLKFPKNPKESSRCSNFDRNIPEASANKVKATSGKIHQKEVLSVLPLIMCLWSQRIIPVVFDPFANYKNGCWQNTMALCGNAALHSMEGREPLPHFLIILL